MSLCNHQLFASVCQAKRKWNLPYEISPKNNCVFLDRQLYIIYYKHSADRSVASFNLLFSINLIKII